MLNLFI